MAKGKGSGNAWWIKLDYGWAQDEKVINLRAKYGKAILVDAVNTFVLMAKCGGLADMAKPAHVEWARMYVGKSGKPLYALFDKLAEFGIIDKLSWESFGHVTSNRALEDAKAVAGQDEANRKRTEKARETLAKKREEEAAKAAI